MKGSKKEQSHRLSNLAGVDEALFKGRKPSAELEAMRKEWTEEFDKRINRLSSKPTEKQTK